jgi:hypothetical protein
MKSLRLLLAALVIGHWSMVIASPAATGPRVLELTGAAHPKAIVQRVDPASGVVLYAFADANGHAIDTGHSLARFTPVEIVTQVSGLSPQVSFESPSDSILAAAIVAPEPAPAVPVPATITRRQLKEYLITADLIDTVEAALNSIADTKARRIALNWWTESQEIRRDHPMVATMAAALGLTPEQLDAAFIAAAQL